MTRHEEESVLVYSVGGEDVVGQPAEPLHCDNCGKDVRRYYPDGRSEPDNVLWIEFSGGYGQFIDPIGHTHPDEYPYKLRLCHECSHALCDSMPAFQRILNPHGSHSHTGEYHREHPDHYGWDYDYDRGTR